MAVKQDTCVSRGCEAQAQTRGLCRKHYELERGSGRLKMRPTRPYGWALKWLREAVRQETDECIEFAGRRQANGYGQLKFRGRDTGAHRVAYILTKGEIPGHLEICHGCGNGHLGCVNPRHLRADTHVANMRDKDAHGRLARGEASSSSKLNEAQVLEIFRSDERTSTLAALYGVGPTAIRNIRTGLRWGWLTGGVPRKKTRAEGQGHVLTVEQVREIYSFDGRSSEIARRFGVARQTVNAIKRGAAWSRVTGHQAKNPQADHPFA